MEVGMHPLVATVAGLRATVVSAADTAAFPHLHPVTFPAAPVPERVMAPTHFLAPALWAVPWPGRGLTLRPFPHPVALRRIASPPRIALAMPIASTGGDSGFATAVLLVLGATDIPDGTDITIRSSTILTGGGIRPRLTMPTANRILRRPTR